VEVESMMKSIHSARAVGLLKLIGLIHLVLPIPAIDEICLPSSNNVVSSDMSDAVKTKKKKNNNEVETSIDNTPEEIVIINQNTKDFHAYGCSAVMIISLLEKASNKDAQLLLETTIMKSNGNVKKDIIDQVSQLMQQETPFLQHFFRDLNTYQSDETAKVLR
jgi:hypothetical protein